MCTRVCVCNMELRPDARRLHKRLCSTIVQALLYGRSIRFSDNVLTMQRFIGAAVSSHGLSLDTAIETRENN